MAEAFAAVKKLPENAMFGLRRQFQEDKADIKLDLSLGAYRDEKGEPVVLESVKDAMAQITHDLRRGADGVEYLPITGMPAFCKVAAELLFGDDCEQLADGCVATVQTVGGTAAVRLAVQLATRVTGARAVYLSQPTWPNHAGIAKELGLSVRSYRYYADATRRFDCEGMLADIRAAPVGSVIVLHGCAHNPTGMDATAEEWELIADALHARKALPIVDCAYQGFATGDVDADAAALRMLTAHGLPLLAAQSFSKNLGLYGARVGALHVVARTRAAAAAVKSQLARMIRRMYSNPPSVGARVATLVLTRERLRRGWLSQLSRMAGRLASLRVAVVAGLRKRGTPGDWSHISRQVGMFAYTGLSAEQCGMLRDKHHIYLPSTGRISVAGLRDDLVPYFCDAVHDVVCALPRSKL